MSEQYADRNDPIHRAFRRLREGFSDVVVHLVDRVDGQLKLYIADERQLSPSFDIVISQAMGDLAATFFSVVGESERSISSAISDDSNGDEPS